MKFEVQVTLKSCDFPHAFREALKEAIKVYEDKRDFTPTTMDIKHIGTLYEYHESYSDKYTFTFEVK